MKRERLIMDFLVKGDLVDFFFDLKNALNTLQNRILRERIAFKKQKEGVIEDYRILRERIFTLVDFEKNNKNDSDNR